MLDLAQLVEADWRRLERMRDSFLRAQPDGEGPGARTRWSDERDLELYDATFGRRIAWKWEAVLAELEERGWRPPHGALLDWGAGTAVAARALLEHGAVADAELRLHDRSPLSLEHARALLLRQHPGLKVVLEPSPPREAPALLLVSHVLNELAAHDLEGLLELARRSPQVLWVEPGERQAGRALSLVRERLRGEMRALAPCPHDERCGALARETDWCHFFARPPAEVFQDRGWGLFARRLGIDLRSVSYSWLLLVQRGAGERAGPTGVARIIGRAQGSKAEASLRACESTGLLELRMRRRDDPALHRALAGGSPPGPFLRIEREGPRVLAARVAELPLDQPNED